MTTQDPDEQSLGDQFAEAAKPRGTMSTSFGDRDPAEAGAKDVEPSDPESVDQESASDALEANTEDLATGENPFSQGEDGPDNETVTGAVDEDETEDGAAGMFSPGRSDQP